MSIDGARNPPITATEALHAYAAMVNSKDPSRLAPMLPEDFRYASQSVLNELDSREAFLDYTTAKLRTIARSGAVVRAQMGTVSYGWAGAPCVILAQDGTAVANVLATLEQGVLRRLDLCTVAPAPGTSLPSGNYPE